MTHSEDLHECESDECQTLGTRSGLVFTILHPTSAEAVDAFIQNMDAASKPTIKGMR